LGKAFQRADVPPFRRNFGINARIGRITTSRAFGTYDGGREKSAGAICRKFIQAKKSGRHEIEIWGDGLQTRSFMYIDDCLKGTLDLMNSGFVEPSNRERRMVSINELG